MNDVKFIICLMIIAAFVGWLFATVHLNRSINPAELSIHTYETKGKDVDVECHVLMTKKNKPLIMECFSTIKE